MPFKVSKHNAFDKGFKKLDQQHKEDFANECKKIQADPTIGDTMHGVFKQLNIKKKSLKSTNPEIRILYKVYNCKMKNAQKLTCENKIAHFDIQELRQCKGFVDFLICGPREMFNNFYKLGIDKIKKYL